MKRFSSRTAPLRQLAYLVMLLTLCWANEDLLSERCFAQSPPTASPQPTPPSQQPDSIRIFTEEVLLPVVATDSNGRFDPSLEAVDLLILEDGEPQTIRSIQRIPASVLLLLDTGGARNPAMKTNETRELAVNLVSQLRSGDHIAALQFGGKVEVIQNWTSEQEAVVHSLKTKLSSGRGGSLTDGLAAASAQLNRAPPGNRHVVLVTDGGESAGEQVELAKSITQLFATQATVHVISYTQLGRKAINEAHPKIPAKITSEKPKSAQDLADELTKPKAPETLDAKLHRKIYLVVDLDFAMARNSRAYLKVLKGNERWLAGLVEESGGTMMLPHSIKELPNLAADLAHQIDSQYLVTYKPKSTATLKAGQEIRHVEVVSRRVGLQVHSRRSYIVPTAQ